MSDKSWEEHWESGHTPWDAGASSPILTSLLEHWPVQAESRPEGRALVTGCGAGYDVFTLAKSHYAALGIDIASGVTPRFEALLRKSGLTEEAAQLRIVDFFTADQGSLGGRFDLIWDYTFYCAIDPSLRAGWAKKMHSLLARDGRLVMLIFPVNPQAPRDQGPPYPLDPEEVTQALADSFERLTLEPVKTSHPGREGKEWLAVFRAR
jgi:SAM-dependent methyltransferase